MKEMNEWSLPMARARFRSYILKRDHWTCRKCGHQAYTWAQAKYLAVAHIFGKGAHPAMQFLPHNAITLCNRTCHLGGAHLKREEFMAWAEKQMPSAQWAALLFRKNVYMKTTAAIEEWKMFWRRSS